MIAAVMAGGKATRFKQRVEKALLEVRGRSLLERSMSALQGVEADEVVVAVTAATPKTAELARTLGVRAIQTSGREYHADVLELHREFGNLLTLNVDVPFARQKDVRRLAELMGDDSLAAVVPAEIALREPDEHSTLQDSSGRRLIWAGINYVTLRPHVKFVVLDEPLLTVNINSEEDLVFAEQLAVASML